MGKLREKYKFFESVILSMIGLALYNIVIQVLVYPGFDRALGHELYGNALTAISVISVAAVSVGVGVNYARMALSARVTSSNGDYNVSLLVGAVLCGAVGILAGRFVGMTGFVSYVLFALMAMAMMLRYYSDVDFRLDTNYRKLLGFYVVLSVGYALGMLVFRFVHQWQIVFLIAEFLAFLFVMFFGKIYRRPAFKLSENHNRVFRSCAELTGSQVFANLILNCDRMLINFFMGGTAVTVFYTASLLGKSIALLTGPFNGVIIGFLAKSDKPITKKFYALCVAGACAVSVIMLGVLIPVTPFIIRLLYPDVAGDAAPYFLLANAGQIAYFISNLLLVIALRFMSERFQLVVNLVYTVLYLALCIPCLMQQNFMAFMQCVLVANLVRLVVVIVAGLWKAQKTQEVEA